eukprot:3899520-Prymnesium_polylepis.1
MQKSRAQTAQLTQTASTSPIRAERCAAVASPTPMWLPTRVPVATVVQGSVTRTRQTEQHQSGRRVLESTQRTREAKLEHEAEDHRLSPARNRLHSCGERDSGPVGQCSEASCDEIESSPMARVSALVLTHANHSLHIISAAGRPWPRNSPQPRVAERHSVQSVGHAFAPPSEARGSQRGASAKRASACAVSLIVMVSGAPTKPRREMRRGKRRSCERLIATTTSIGCTVMRCVLRKTVRSFLRTMNGSAGNRQITKSRVREALSAGWPQSSRSGLTPSQSGSVKEPITTAWSSSMRFSSVARRRWLPAPKA